MPWAQYDAVDSQLLSVVNHLPESIVSSTPEQLAALGYYELVIEQPVDAIRRFPQLLGSSLFTLEADGKVHQTFPDANFSVAKVRETLIAEMKSSQFRIMNTTDWYYVRQIEEGTPVPEEVKTVRQRQRAYGEDVEQQIETMDERSLIDFEWTWPTSINQTMERGVPVRHVTLPPDEPPAINEEPAPPPPDPTPPPPEETVEAGPILPLIEDTPPPVHPPTVHPPADVPAGPTPIFQTPKVNMAAVPPTTDGPVEVVHDPTLPPVPAPIDGTPREVRP